MGMAASQARLLAITARIHDTEYQAQSIQNAKVQLATQSDQVYQDYLAALDATSLTITDWEGNTMVANFNAIVGRNAVDTGKNKYAIKTDRGELVVPNDIYEAYQDFKAEGLGNDPYKFALYTLDPNGLRDYLGNENEDAVLEELKTGEDATSSNVVSMCNLKDSMQKVLTDNGYSSYEELCKAYEETPKDYTTYEAIANAKTKYDQLQNNFRHILYENYSEQVFNQAAGYNDDDTGTEYNQENFTYYVNMYKQIQAAGGNCVSIDDYNGPEGDAANNSDWLKNMVSAGKFTIENVNVDPKSGEVSFNTTAPNSDTYIGEEATSNVDKKALARAEAKYEHETKKINQKDKNFDLDLSKLETERTALTTEYDSVKKVINDNIERTFGIFS